jgi:alkylation response protein AidB-like acyl-CoA dehydrogenase
MAAGEIRGALCPDGDEYVVNGTKLWITNGTRAGIVALAARTPEGITCFIVEKEPGEKFGGITVSRNIGKLGYKGIETVEMVWDGHRVGADCVLGGPEGLGRGQHYILSALEVGRINIAARSVGVARAAFEAAIHYAQQRETFGKPIAQHQAIQTKLADMATQLQAARLLTEHAAALKESGERCDVEAGMAKLFASEAAFEIATEAMRIHGGMGYSTELPVERYYRDAPLMLIGEGTNEIQRLVIARGLLSRYPV